jgi:hypothetical protein
MTVRWIDYGFSFDCDLSFWEIFTRLNEIGPWTWEERDSAWFGLIATARTASIKLDFFESGFDEQGGRVEAGNGQQYAISVRKGRVPPSEHEWAAVELGIRTELLPSLGARDIKPTDPID